MSQLNVLLVIITYVVLKSGTTFADSPLLNVENLNNTSDFIGLATKYGFSATSYEVITEDGYILTLFHIPGRSRFPVFLLHGIMDSSDTWFLRGEDSLAVTLASRGYDLWFGNSRGNRYSRRHVQLNPDEDKEFWKYSFHEMGVYDLPAFIDKILEETGAESLTAIGHSQGTTSFYVLGSVKPEYNNKVNVVISLAPACYFKHSIRPLATLFEIGPLVIEVAATINLQEFAGDTTSFAHFYRTLCSTPVIGYAVCANGVYFPFSGYDAEELEPSFYPTIVAHYPAGTSMRSLAHYLQLGHTKVFAPYDENFYRNKSLHNSTSPPPYDLSKNNMPIALIAGRNDRFSMIPDVLLLKQQLTNVVYYVVNPHKKFNHLDYIWGKRMRVYLFPHIFELLQRYNSLD